MTHSDPEAFEIATGGRETEYVAAAKLQEGDQMPKYGTVLKVLNDSTVLSVDTSDPPYGFMKSQHAPVERYVRQPGRVYGLEWLRRQEPTCRDSIRKREQEIDRMNEENRREWEEMHRSDTQDT